MRDEKKTKEQLVAELRDLRRRVAALEMNSASPRPEGGRRQAEYTDRFRLLYEEAPLPYQSLDINGDVIDVNQAWLEALGYSEEEVLGKNFRHFLHSDQVAHFTENFPRFKAAGEVHGVEFEMVRKDGSTILVSFNGRIGRDDSGDFRQTHCIFQDITGKKHVEEALRKSRAMLETALTSMTDAMFITDAAGRFLAVNDAFVSFYKFKDKTECFKNIDEYPDLLEVFQPDKSPAPFDLWSVPRALRGESATNCEYCLRRRDTGETWVGSYSFGPIRNKDGMIVGAVVVARDITKEKEAEEALRKSQREMTLLYQISKVFLTTSDEQIYEQVLKVILDAFECELGVFGYLGDSGDLIISTLTRGVWDECRVEGKSIVFPHNVWGNSIWGKAITQKRGFLSEGPFRTPKGHVSVKNFLTVPLVFNDKTIGIVSLANKVSGFTSEDKPLLERIATSISPILHTRLQRDLQEQERRRAEQALRNKSDELQLILDTMPATIWFKDRNNRILRVNRSACEMMGMGPTEIEGRYAGEVFPDWLAEKYFQDDLEVINSGRPRMGIEEQLTNGAGELRWVKTDKVPWRDEQGALAGVLAFVVDITEARRGEEERAKLQAQLNQAQKLESVGRLAGGVAHDFNNMLGVILGYTELALQDVDPAQLVYADLEEIKTAANRSANLVRQLLAFARRQTVAPRLLDINAAVESMLKMVRRLIGENIQLTWFPGSDLWPVKIDPTQIDQILANLCVNARDAIAGVGGITLETGNNAIDETFCRNHPEATPGDFVFLSVRDDGCGMGKETLGKLFEPFFTTKEVGKGTGLGLSTVYGIVGQNGGFVTVDSELGRGTTFKIYLPKTNGPEALEQSEEQRAPNPKGVETILLVEDEKSILAMGKKILERHGYGVLAASSPQEALELARNHSSRIDLLITDVIMPAMNGKELAEKLSELVPGLKTLFMSGYTGEVIAESGVVDEGVNFLPKPFSLKTLTEKVREMLRS
ncbi:MAG: PAS domain S-box protein [Syntrophobacteraceae bacterium]|nr:PAS domain S-box protein [Syntrophobacteraceae bacterium]